MFEKQTTAIYTDSKIQKFRSLLNNLEDSFREVRPKMENGVWNLRDKRVMADQ